MLRHRELEKLDTCEKQQEIILKLPLDSGVWHSLSLSLCRCHWKSSFWNKFVTFEISCELFSPLIGIWAIVGRFIVMRIEVNPCTIQMRFLCPKGIGSSHGEKWISSDP